MSYSGQNRLASLKMEDCKSNRKTKNYEICDERVGDEIILQNRANSNKIDINIPKK